VPTDAPLVLGDVPPALPDVVAVARRARPVTLSVSAIAHMAASRGIVEQLAASSTPVYGISTGFGALANREIDVDQRVALQRSVVRSHAAGMGDVVDTEIVRALMLLRAKTLASGHAGARPLVAEAICSLLNAGITPVVYEYGSLGCSGDLAPLAHCALTLLGEGEAHDAAGRRAPSAGLLAAAGLAPIELEAKEGLSLINGTDGMLGMLVLACTDLGHLLRLSDLAAAMSTEALFCTDQAFRPELVALRPQPGQALSADNLFRILAGSAIVASHRAEDTRVQDAYSVRCAPQVNGAARDTLAHARTVATYELASAIDNPVVLEDGTVASNGNFHGAPLAMVLDFLAIAAADVGSIAERRTDRLLDRTRSHGLPAFLAHDPGVDSGLMIAQYTQAALVSENKRLASPASVDSIPSSGMQEDHVAMGWSAGLKLRQSLENLRRIVAIELTVAARGLALRAPLDPAPATAAALRILEPLTGPPGPDRFTSPELAAVEASLVGDELVRAVESVAGPLH